MGLFVACAAPLCQFHHTSRVLSSEIGFLTDSVDLFNVHRFSDFPCDVRAGVETQCSRWCMADSRRHLVVVSTESRNRACGPSIQSGVDNFVVVKAPGFNKIQRTSTGRPQTIQQESLRSNKNPYITITLGIWFGTRRSVVQIHSPRPFYSATSSSLPRKATQQVINGVLFTARASISMVMDISKAKAWAA
jgi:hypothetical protein